MARINTTQLIEHATSFTDRIDQVQRDPAVRKAWTEAAGDATAAFTSAKSAANETRAAWRRSGGADVTGAYA